MKKKRTYAFIASIFVVLAIALAYAVHGHTLTVLHPSGAIGKEESDLIMVATFLMLIVVIPVFILTFAIAWRYRASNTKAKYTPDWEHSKMEEFVWWAVPFVIILALATITWKSSHQLDPYKPLDSNIPPITVDVVALNWKWLFIYPDQNIATVNFLKIPVDTPIDFRVTADAPMNSFWIPALGGQIYAMSGMTTQLHLIADKKGSYPGMSANFSGKGFSGMKFDTEAVSRDTFNKWIASVKRSPHDLTAHEYTMLAEPSQDDPPAYYGSVTKGLYDKIVGKYMYPASSTADIQL